MSYSGSCDDIRRVIVDDQTAVTASAIAAAISAAAAVIAAIVGGVALWLQHRGNRPRVRVSWAMVAPVYGAAVGGPWLSITAFNAGAIPVRVISAGFRMKDGGTAPYLGPAYGHPVPDPAHTIPALLGPGDEVTVYFPDVRALAEAHVGEHGPITRVWVTTGGGREYSKRFLSDSLAAWATAKP
jgi:hypothetical protein